jgi:hypothetical protein
MKLQLKEMERSKKKNEVISKFLRKTNPALFELVKLCGQPNVKMLLTTNLDALLQLCDRAVNGSPKSLRTIERASKSIKNKEKVPLYHLHGYIRPYKTSSSHEAADVLVLTEREYVERNDDPYNWAAVMLHWALRDSPMIFVGCSMTDSLIRRALFRTRSERLAARKAEGKNNVTPRHFVVYRFEKHLSRELFEKSMKLLDLNVLWVEDFEKDLPRRFKVLRTSP